MRRCSINPFPAPGCRNCIEGGTAGLLYPLLGVAKEWSGEMHMAVQIDLSFRALPEAYSAE